VIGTVIPAETTAATTAAAGGAVWLQPLGGGAAVRLGGHEGPVTTVAGSADGSLVASGSADGTVIVAETGTGRSLGVLTAHEAGVSAVAFEDGGENRLATGGAGGAVTLWDPRLGQPLRKIKGHERLVTALAFRCGGRVLVTGGEDDTVRMWLSTYGTAGHVLRRRGPVAALAMDPDGTQLAVALRTGISVRKFNWPANITPIFASLGQMIRGDVFFWGELMAGALLGSVPVAIIYSFFVEHYVAGLTAGAVKG